MFLSFVSKRRSFCVCVCVKHVLTKFFACHCLSSYCFYIVHGFDHLSHVFQMFELENQMEEKRMILKSLEDLDSLRKR